MLHVYYRWGMVSFLLIRYVCVCFLFLCQWVLACLCWKYSVFGNGVGKDRTQIFLCQCLTYVHFQFYLPRLSPSKLHAEGKWKDGGHSFCILVHYGFFICLFCICLFLTDYGCLWRKMEWSKRGNWFSHVFYDFLPPMIFLWRNSLFVLF